MTRRVERTDILVIGAGPAGIAAAVSASERGARVLLIDEGVMPGGQIWRSSTTKPAPPLAQRWLQRLQSSSAKVLSSTSVIDARAVAAGHFEIVATSGRDEVQIEASRVILATGARERFVPFPGWTLPNVFGIGGAQALLKSGTRFAGRRVVIAGSGPLLLPVAASLKNAGAKLLFVAEQAPASRVFRFASSLWKSPRLLAQAGSLRSSFATTPFATGTWVTQASGGERLESVTLTDGRRVREIACDVLCTGYGLVPNVELARLLGCAVSNGVVGVDDLQMTDVRDLFCAGEPTGIGGVDLALVEGEIAGRGATNSGVSDGLIRRRHQLRDYSRRLAEAFALRPELSKLAQADTIVCRCEDVRFGSLDPAWSSRQAKLYTRAGMGPCQGRICGPALECIMGWTSDSVRPPVQPARVAAMLGSGESH